MRRRRGEVEGQGGEGQGDVAGAGGESARSPRGSLGAALAREGGAIAQGGGSLDRGALVVPREAGGGRLDRFLAAALGISRSEAQRWIAAQCVDVEGAHREPSSPVREGERIEVRPPMPPASAAQPETDVRFEVLYVDDEIVVVDKPAGLVVHPARGHAGGTLVNGLLGMGLFRREDIEALADGAGATGAGSELPEDRQRSHDRPGIVHRLDKGTSGVMIVARTVRARDALKAQFQAHSIERAYEALVVGQATARTFDTLHGRHPHDRLRFTTHVRTGKRAVTRVQVLAPLAGATHIECTLETGRTHQIRVHLAEGGTPVLGDPVYGKAPRDPHVRAVGEELGHQALHARLLGFVHPGTGEHVRFETAPPADFERARSALHPSG